MRPTQNQHCQTSTGWNVVKVDGKTMAEAAAAWYFDGSEEKHVDAPFPGNPTCGQSHGRRVLAVLAVLAAGWCLSSLSGGACGRLRWLLPVFFQTIVTPESPDP